MSGQAGETTPLLHDATSREPGQHHERPRSRRIAYSALSESPDAKLDNDQVGGPVSSTPPMNDLPSFAANLGMLQYLQVAKTTRRVYEMSLPSNGVREIIVKVGLTYS